MLEKQNDTDNILRLAAQRQMYSESKKYHAIAFWPGILLMMIMAALEIFLTEIDLTPWVFIVSLSLILINDFLYMPKFETLRTKAAEIQDQFDTRVFSLKPGLFVSTNMSQVEIEHIGQLHLALDSDNQASLKNWYGFDPQGLPAPVVALIGLRTNFYWSAKLGLLYLRYLLVCLGLLAMVGVVVVWITYSRAWTTLPDAVFLLIAVLSPAFSFFWGQRQEHQSCVNDYGDRINAMNELWQRTLTSEVPTDTELRQVQNMLFNMRSTGPLVPDFIYRLHRSEQQVSADAQAEGDILAYKKAIAQMSTA